MRSFNYLVPALFYNATIQPITNLGNLSTGGSLIFGQGTGTLRSEPGFEPNFTATLTPDVDFATTDPDGKFNRVSLRALVKPDDGSTPFEMLVTSVSELSTELIDIVEGKATGLQLPYGSTQAVWVPQFRGGGKKFANLQNSIFVGSATVSSGRQKGEWRIGVKISKVFCTNTSVVIGQEFPEGPY